MEGNERKHLSRMGQMGMIADNFSGHANRPRPRPRLCADNERTLSGRQEAGIGEITFAGALRLRERRREEESVGRAGGRGGGEGRKQREEREEKV